MNASKSEVVNEIPHLERHNDRLIFGDAPQRAPVEMIEMGVGDEHRIDGWQIVNSEPWVSDALDNFQPLGPVRIDQEIHPRRLKQK